MAGRLGGGRRVGSKLVALPPIKPPPFRPPLPRPPVPPASGSAREYAERLVQSVIMRKQRIAEQFYAMGVELRELSRPELFQALGFGSFVELIETRKIVSRMQALRLTSIVESFPRELAMKLGLDKAYSLVRYAAATPAQDVARVLAERNVVIGGKRLTELTYREIDAETTRLRSGGRVRNPREPEAQEARGGARAIQRALRSVGATKAKARAVWDGGVWEVRVEMTAQEARTAAANM